MLSWKPERCMHLISFYIITGVIGLISGMGHAGDGHLMEFISEPSTVMVNREKRAVFRCSASPPGVHIDWLQNGHPVIEDSAGIIRVTSNKLTVKLRNISHEGFAAKSPEHMNYLVAKGRHHLQCLARLKGQAIISQPARVMYAELSSFPSHPDVHISVVKGNTAVILCSPPDSVPKAITEFSFNSHKLNFKPEKYIILPSGNLQILNTHANDTGAYQCSAHNPFLNERKAAKHRVHLKVNEPARNKSVNFTYSIKHYSISAVMGSNITLECVAEGYPLPSIIWHRKNVHLPHQRHHQNAGNLELLSVRRSDEGIYTCKAHNTLGRVSTETHLKVLEIPHILQPPESQQALEGDNVMFHCKTDGRPLPNLTWYHNGVKIHENTHFLLNGSTIWIRNAKSSHDGIYQCFATNELGTVHAAGLLSVSSDQITSSNNTRTGNDYYGDPEFDDDDEDSDDITRNHNWKRKSKGVKMVPPSRPEVNRISDDSVMVRWSVAHNDGLPINFFKVQYQEIEGNVKGPWNTIDEDIAAHIYSYAVTQLKPGGKYRFRIAAVYSNNDNRDGPKSAKFILTKDPLLKRPRFAPVIIYAEAQSPSAITLKWEFSDADSTPITGFFIYYRATHSAGDYFKTTVLGANTQSDTISHLLPQTSYDLKMQCFSPAGTSDFSNIYTCKTMSSDSLDPNSQFESDSSGSKEGSYTIKESTANNTNRHMILGIILGVLGLLVLVGLLWVLVNRYRKPSQEESVPDESSHPKHLVNGYTQNYMDQSKINIQVNPLSEADAGKTIDFQGPYSLMEYQEEPSNNNEFILLSSLQRNRKNSTTT